MSASFKIVFINAEDSVRAALEQFCTPYLCEGAGASLEAGGVAQAIEIDVSSFKPPMRIGAVVDRIHALMRQRVKKMSERDLKIGVYTLDKARSQLKKGTSKAAINLTDKERDILETLYHAGKTGVDKQALLSSVWGFVEGLETHTLETHIYRLRQKIEGDPVKPDIILTTDTGYALSFEE